MLVKKDNNINYIIGLTGELNFFKKSLKYISSPNKCLRVYKKDDDSYYYLFNANKSVAFNKLLDYYLAKNQIRNTDIMFDFLINKINVYTINKDFGNWEKSLYIYKKTKKLIFQNFKLNEIKNIKDLQIELQKDWVKFNPNLIDGDALYNLDENKIYKTLQLIPYDQHYSKYLVLTNEMRRVFDTSYFSVFGVLIKALVEYINAVNVNIHYYNLMNSLDDEKELFKKSIMKIVCSPNTHYNLKTALIENYEDIITYYKKGVYLEFLSQTQNY